jgi:hypothetical protein
MRSDRIDSWFGTCLLSLTGCLAALFVASEADAGALFPGQKFPVGNLPVSVAVADLDGDTIPDLVTANTFGDDVSVLLNRRPPACRDGFDNDGDGHIDHPDDAGCMSPDSDIEDPQCDDQLDNDGDGFCDNLGSTCLDGSTPGDRDCVPFAFRDSEIPICSDGMDNDGDGFVDLADPQCADASQRSESWIGCGLGWEVVLVVPLLVWAQRHRRRAARRIV